MQEQNDNQSTEKEAVKSLDFIRQKITDDVAAGKNMGKVVTRFPPEPNGFLHIGHAKSICLNFGVAQEFGGVCHLRMDDTNPCKEEAAYADAIQEDVRWLGFDWGSHEYFASDYFDQLYGFALELIKKGKAYVCDLNAEEVRAFRGTLTESGKNSPFRDRSVEENLALFERMRLGEFDEGVCSLRAKIDMASPNMNLRDPAIYRIRKIAHHRTGEKWCMYPMYDFAHCFSDAIEGITHSLCTLEFENHRPLYDWFLDQIDVPCHPQQIEFARLNLTHTIMSKRKLLQLVQETHVAGWDDPRMPTISGLRRRGYTPEAIRDFCARVGIAKVEGTSQRALLEHCLREDLNQRANRVMAVLNPLKVVITNYEQESEELDAINNPNDASAGSRKIPFSKELYIEASDFMEDAPRKFFRLAPGREVRLRYAYYITCHDVIRDPETNEILELHCTYDPQTKGGRSDDGRKVKGTLHWVSATHAIKASVRAYENLFCSENPDKPDQAANFIADINPDSFQVNEHCYCEPSLAAAQIGTSYQFERTGYFCLDLDSTKKHLIFNRTVGLRDAWAKQVSR